MEKLEHSNILAFLFRRYIEKLNYLFDYKLETKDIDIKNLVTLYTDWKNDKEYKVQSVFLFPQFYFKNNPFSIEEEISNIFKESDSILFKLGIMD